jgi:hypothetical protein
MTARTLYGRLFSLVPGHFSRRGKLYATTNGNYYEKFKFGDNTGEFFFYVHAAYNMEVSVITIKNPLSNPFLYEKYKVTGGYTTHTLQSVSKREVLPLDFDQLSDQVHELIDRKTDSDILSCSCCGWKASM